MKHLSGLLLIASLLTPALTIAAPADAPTLNGKWQIHISIADHESDHTCTFTQKDSDLTGSCTTDNGDANLTGKVSDKNVTWVYKSQYEGSPITLTYKGTLDPANKLAGTVNVAEYSVDGEFTGTPAK